MDQSDARRIFEGKNSLPRLAQERIQIAAIKVAGDGLVTRLLSFLPVSLFFAFIKYDYNYLK